LTSVLNPRTISNILGQEPFGTPLVDENGKTLVSILLGQFVNHDLEKNAHVNEHTKDFSHIDIDPNDPICYLPVGGGRPSTENTCPENPNFLYRPSAGEVIDGQFRVRNQATP
jgi:hypothetical protein